eukprot:scaffold55684_cov101-Phaeocystis_antarctica.AAC.4
MPASERHLRRTSASPAAAGKRPWSHLRTEMQVELLSRKAAAVPPAAYWFPRCPMLVRVAFEATLRPMMAAAHPNPAARARISGRYRRQSFRRRSASWRAKHAGSRERLPNPGPEESREATRSRQHLLCHRWQRAWPRGTPTGRLASCPAM